MIVTIRFKLFSALNGLSLASHAGGAQARTIPFGIEMYLNMAPLQQLKYHSPADSRRPEIPYPVDDYISLCRRAK